MVYAHQRMVVGTNNAWCRIVVFGQANEDAGTIMQPLEQVIWRSKRRKLLPTRFHQPLLPVRQLDMIHVPFAGHGAWQRMQRDWLSTILLNNEASKKVVHEAQTSTAIG